MVFIVNIGVKVVFTQVFDKEFLFFVILVSVNKNKASKWSVVDAEVVELNPRVKIIVSSSSFSQCLKPDLGNSNDTLLSERRLWCNLDKIIEVVSDKVGIK